LRGPATVAVRLGPRARGARRAPAVSQGARGAVGPGGLARGTRRGAARGGGGGRGRHRHARGAPAVRAILAGPGRLRVAGSVVEAARLPRGRAHVRADVGRGRAGGRAGKPRHPVTEPEPLRHRGPRPPGSRRLLPARAEVPRRARVSAVPPARAAHHHRDGRGRDQAGRRRGRRGPARIIEADRVSAGGRPAGPRAAHRGQGTRRPAGRAGAGAGGLPRATPKEPRYHRRGGGSGRMAVLKVRRYGDPVLRRRAEPIATVTPEIRRLADDMIETMYDEVGSGAQVLVNPVITEQGGTVTAEEGCLSLPGFFAPVTRAQWVKVEAQDLEGQPLSLTARGLRSRVFQHEIDHLDGVLFIDRVDAVTRDRMKRRIKKDGFTEDASA